MRDRIRRVYESLLAAYGPQGWWPSKGPFETIVGAVLTQGTAWTNASRAIEALRRARALDPGCIAALQTAALERLIRPAGFHTRKTRTLAALSNLIERHPGGLDGLLSLDPSRLRVLLLGVEGVGDETADSILLYAAGQVTFVADAYARRFATRHGIVSGDATYAQVKQIFLEALPADPPLLGECHALLVELGKRACGTSPRCEGCPLAWDLPNPSGENHPDSVNISR